MGLVIVTMRSVCYFAVAVLPLLMPVAIEAKYPNEILDTPIVTCEPTKVSIKVKTSHSNPSHIYAEDFHDSSKCMVRNMNKLSIPHGECGMTTEHMCVYMEANVVDDLEKSINISEMIPSELEPQFDEASNPHCSYSIRKGSVDGPEAHAAVVGESVFHVWQCDNENVGILVQNCHVEDLQGDKILIIDQNGCGIDQYLFHTPHYTNDLHTAYLESNVFKFVDKSMTRFRCQLRLCVKNRGQGCDSVTPPTSCPNVDDEGVVSRSPPSTPSGTATSPSSPSSPSNRPTPPPSARPPSGNTAGPPAMRMLNNGEGGGMGLSTPINANVFRPPPMVVANSGSPPSMSYANGAVNSPSSTVARTIGPPSIRPFGLSTAHIVSGKGSANAAAMVGGSKHFRAGTNSSSQPFTGANPSISVIGSSHQSGYPYRNRRSTTMIYGTAIRHYGPTRPGAAEGRIHKRETNTTLLQPPETRDNSSTTHPIVITASTQRAPARRKLPELDVVGLIRVLDNPDDIGGSDYHPDGNPYHRRLVTANKHGVPPARSVGSPPGPQSLPQSLPEQPASTPNQPLDSLPTHAAPQALSNTAHGGGEETKGGTNRGDEEAKCLPRNMYYALVTALALLSTIQLVGITFLLIDRFVLGKAASKRIYEFVRHR